MNQPTFGGVGEVGVFVVRHFLDGRAGHVDREAADAFPPDVVAVVVVVGHGVELAGWNHKRFAARGHELPGLLQ